MRRTLPLTLQHSVSAAIAILLLNSDESSYLLLKGQEFQKKLSGRLQLVVVRERLSSMVALIVCLSAACI